MDTTLRAAITDAAAYLEDRLGAAPADIAIILGSGLNPLAECIEDAKCVPFQDVPHMETSTAEGHVGRFVCGTLAGKRVIAMQGRLHGYEGYSAIDVAFPVWIMQRLGAKVLVTTNAAGAINESFRVGDFCVMSDQINLTGRNPIANREASLLSERFFSMTGAFSDRLRRIAHEVAVESDVPLREGVYLGLLGPSFETPAEIRAFRVLGADTVAMSVVEEVIAARHAGMEVLGISLLSNMAAGVEGSSPTGEEVMKVAETRESAFQRLVTGIIKRT